MGAGDDTANSMDSVKWLLALLLLGGALAAFYFYADQSLLLRVVGLLAVAGISAAILLQTDKGRIAWGFAREARTEVRKVVWPTRKETTQTTTIVIAMVALVAIVLWMLDGLLGWLMRMVLEQGG